MAWRTMRDNYYDPALNKRDWNAVLAKYAPVAEKVPDAEGLATVVQLMLGELNGSHLGFYPGISSASQRRSPAAPEPGDERSWSEQTVHLGVRFDPNFAGPGWKVKDVIPEGPADRVSSRLMPGDRVIAIDGREINNTKNPAEYLNLPPGREVMLLVRAEGRDERKVTITPTTYSAIRPALYKMFVRDNRKQVEELSKGKLGYLHIAAMDGASFDKFQEDLYAAGAGKDGLIIDVRANGGGSTADLLLTALTQPVHAIAVPRGGGPGYPQDRTVFATWTKPITVLCDQNSFSNAEIFSHAIKTLKRGPLVGVPTAGGVISTGGTTIMDVGFLRLPFRGWYVVGTGDDMELNGAVPDVLIWKTPGDAAQGKDVQLAKAVEVLAAEVAKPKPAVILKPASAR